MAEPTEAKKRRSTDLTAQQEARIVKRLREGLTFAVIAEQFGRTASTIDRICEKHGLREIHRQSMGNDPRIGRTALPAAGPAPDTPRKLAPLHEAPIGPQRVVASRPGRLTRAEEDALVREAIDQGLGRRYETVVQQFAQGIETAADATAWLESVGCKVRVLRKRGGSLIYYQALLDGQKMLTRSWYPARELVALARERKGLQGAATRSIAEAERARAARSDIPADNPSLIRYHRPPSQTPAFAAHGR